ncbi:MAG TPA: DUF2993 domain-containing protein [Oculatellaceae cyanobacterium]|jgi:hypothetical protein
MELISILLSGLLIFISPAGLVIDRAAESAIRSRLQKVEQLEVRVDNTPVHQTLQGKIDRVRIAGRGLWLTKDVRIDTLELETDPLDIDLQRLRQSNPKLLLESLKSPIQSGVHLVLKENDINQTLKSPQVLARLQQVINQSLGSSALLFTRRYEIFNPRVKFLGDQRLSLQVELKQPNSNDQLSVNLETGIGVVAGSRLQLISPTALVNGKPIPPQLVQSLTARFNSKADLRTLEKYGITSRLLKLDVKSDRLDIAAFVKLDKPTTTCI